MPTLMRILFVFAVLFAIGYGALWALANNVEPHEREITLTVPLERAER